MTPSLIMDDSVSDLCERFSALCINTPLKRNKPRISLHRTSWVAGGYWCTESERQLTFNMSGNLSFSQRSEVEPLLTRAKHIFESLNQYQPLLFDQPINYGHYTHPLTRAKEIFESQNVYANQQCSNRPRLLNLPEHCFIDARW